MKKMPATGPLSPRVSAKKEEDPKKEENEAADGAARTESNTDSLAGYDSAVEKAETESTGETASDEGIEKADTESPGEKTDSTTPSP